MNIDDAAGMVRSLIEKSVVSQMISDVPLGFFLSGGIDSSIIVTSASKFSEKLSTFSIGFDIPIHNETRFSRHLAESIGTSHFEKILDIKSANSLLNRFKEWYDEPFADTSAIPSYLVSAFAKQNSTVVLTGDGGDELFGGYDWYERYLSYSERFNRLLCPFQTPINFLKRQNRYSIIGRIANQLEYRLIHEYDLYAKLLGGLLPFEKRQHKTLWQIPDDYDDYWYFRKYSRSDLTPKKRLQYLDFHTYLHDDIFTKVDRVSMSVALECRIPFMSRDIVEFVFSLPEEIIFYDNRKKGLLKYAYRNIIPDVILERPKKGFNIPLFSWNRGFLQNSSTQQERILDFFNVK